MPKIDARLLLPGQQFQIPDTSRDKTFTVNQINVASIDGVSVFLDVVERIKPLQLIVGEEVELIPSPPIFHKTWNAETQQWVCLVETPPGTNLQLDLNDATLFEGDIDTFY